MTTISDIPIRLLFPKLTETYLKDERPLLTRSFRQCWLPESRVICKHISKCLWMIEENNKKEKTRRVYTVGNDGDVFNFAHFSFCELCRMCRGFAKIGMVCKELSEFLKWKMVKQYATEYSGEILFVQYADRVLVFRVRKCNLYATGGCLYDRVKSELMSMIQEKCNDCMPFQTNVLLNRQELMKRLTVQERDNPKATTECMSDDISRVVRQNVDFAMWEKDSAIIAKNVVSYELVGNCLSSFDYSKNASLADQWMSMTIELLLRAEVLQVRVLNWLWDNTLFEVEQARLSYGGGFDDVIGSTDIDDASFAYGGISIKKRLTQPSDKSLEFTRECNQEFRVLQDMFGEESDTTILKILLRYDDKNFDIRHVYQLHRIWYC